MMIFHLARKGYGTVNEIEDWDTPKLLDAIEYERITNDIERYHLESD